jgi:hypothetical protein
MITILLIVLTIVGIFALVKLIDKFVPQNKKWIFTILFWVLAIFIGNALYNSIMEPIEFKKIKKVRFAKVIDNLKDIRDAEIAHKTVTGKYTGDWNSLVKFIDTAKYTLTQRRDTTIMDIELSKQFGIDMTKDIVIIDTLGTASVKDSIFKNSDRYKTMMNIPGAENKQFSLKAGEIVKGKSSLSVFEAKMEKKLILTDQPEYLVFEESETVAVDGVNGANISVGSMNEISTSGNWPKYYENKK